MSCAHCCFSMEKGKPGEFMEPWLFEEMVDVAVDWDMTLNVGGGEPLLHPESMDMIKDAILTTEAHDSGYIWLATNGSVKKRSLELHDLVGLYERFEIQLSQTPWHDEIKPEVVSVFEASGAIRSTNYDTVINVGAAEANELGDPDDQGCACEAIHVKPNGDTYLCGCPDAIKLGSWAYVRNEMEPLSDALYEMENTYGSECSRRLKEDTELLEFGFTTEDQSNE